MALSLPAAVVRESTPLVPVLLNSTVVLLDCKKSPSPWTSPAGGPARCPGLQGPRILASICACVRLCSLLWWTAQPVGGAGRVRRAGGGC